MRFVFFVLFQLLLSCSVYGQQLSQVVRGTVVDEMSQSAIIGATVVVVGTNPVLGAITDSIGGFVIAQVPAGRYNIQVSAMGYEPFIVKEVLVAPGKQPMLTISMKATRALLKEVTVKYRTKKEKPLNNMATVSARMLSVEEAKRFAGGFDDPARLASSFAGVASNVGNNGIVVRGNAPHSLQWKMEGIEIPNPNHFADLSALGGGGLTALSSNLLANSDFMTGAFPAEYSNALSGVFDIFMRNGNNQKAEHTFQVGIIGIDAASEGPFKKGGKSSYLFNYRYSTLGLVAPILPDNAGGVNYQDLSFKLNFPTKKAGVFSLWGIGLIDKSGAKAKTDSANWQYASDKEEQLVQQYMGAAGINHTLFLNNTLYLKTTLAVNASGLDVSTERLNSQLQLAPDNKIYNNNTDVTLSSYLNKKFGVRHTNRTGINIRNMRYDLNLDKSLTGGTAMQNIVATSGSSFLLTGYTNSALALTDKVKIVAGVNAQYFTLNQHYTIEPRAAVSWQVKQNKVISLGYGLHSRLDRINYFFNRNLKTGESGVNRNLDFTKAHHLVAGYDWNASELIHLKVEAYYQRLYHVPVIADSSFSFTNLQTDWFFADKLQNTGEGENYGLDLTLDKYMSSGYYFLVSASLFESKYKAGDNVWRSSRYNRNYLINVLAGKELWVGKDHKKVWSINGRLTYQGGDHYTPLNYAATRTGKEVVADEQNAYALQLPATLTAHLTASFKINRKRLSHEIALKVINISGTPDFYGYRYNYKTNAIDKHEEVIFIPNLSYRIDF